MSAPSSATPALSSVPNAPKSITINALRFTSDTSYTPQSETTVAVNPNNVSQVVGGVNDARLFFCSNGFFGGPITCPVGSIASLSGFSTSADGGTTMQKSDDIENICPTFGSSCTFLISWGDPSVAFGPNGAVYYASLAISPTGSANGVMIAESNSNLFSGSGGDCVSFTTTNYGDSNNCWGTHFIFGDLSGALGTFEDKELIAVDMDHSSPTFGSVYVSWDHFYPDGTSSTYLAICASDISSCTMLSGGATPTKHSTDNVISGSFQFVAFSTPAVDKNGNVYDSACNYGTTTTLGPITCFIESSPAGGTSFGSPVTIMSFMGSGTTFPFFTGLSGLATEQFRTDSLPVIAVDTSSSSNNVYFVVALCTSSITYYDFDGTAFPGDCGSTSIAFSSSTNGGSTWSKPVLLGFTGYMSVQPWVSVDSSSGLVTVTFATTRSDPFNHRLDIVEGTSSNFGVTWTYTKLTSASDEPDSDPAMYNNLASSGFGGSQIVPQYGDYLQAQAFNGKLYVSFTGSYTMEQGTFQSDPYLLVH